MPAPQSVNKQLAARIRFASTLGTEPHVSRFQAHGGLPEDLQRFIAHGEAASEATTRRNLVRSEGRGATETVDAEFNRLQREYLAVMSVATAVYGDLEDAGASKETLKKLKGILANEAQVVVKPEGDGADKKRKAKLSRSREAIRAEIERDATAFIWFKDAHPFFAKRRVDIARFEGLKETASKLTGLVAARDAKRGASVSGSASARNEIAQANKIWSRNWRIFELVAEADPEIGNLLKQTKRT